MEDSNLTHIYRVLIGPVTAKVIKMKKAQFSDSGLARFREKGKKIQLLSGEKQNIKERKNSMQNDLIKIMSPDQITQTSCEPSIQNS